jgi:hypothetical protein
MPLNFLFEVCILNKLLNKDTFINQMLCIYLSNIHFNEAYLMNRSEIKIREISRDFAKRKCLVG